jgi:isoleucyl-tRNA synthetase
MDAQLTADMESLLRLVSLGSAARNAVKIKVRQPLAELKVQPGNDSDRRAVERFRDQMCEELNVKRVTIHDSGMLLVPVTKPNNKTLGPKFGARLKEVQAAITAADPAMLQTLKQKGESFMLGEFPLDSGDVLVEYNAAEGWAGVVDRGTQVAIDSRITLELAAEGMARDVIRHVQDLRKQAGLEMEDRITLYHATQDAGLRAAIETHRDYIAGETLTIQWANAPLDGTAKSVQVKVEGKALTIALMRAG